MSHGVGPELRSRQFLLLLCVATRAPSAHFKTPQANKPHVCLVFLAHIVHPQECLHPCPARWANFKTSAAAQTARHAPLEAFAPLQASSRQTLVVPSQASVQLAPRRPQYARRAATERRPACQRLCLARVGTTAHQLEWQVRGLHARWEAIACWQFKSCTVSRRQLLPCTRASISSSVSRRKLLPRGWYVQPYPLPRRQHVSRWQHAAANRLRKWFKSRSQSRLEDCGPYCRRHQYHRFLRSHLPRPQELGGGAGRRCSERLCRLLVRLMMTKNRAHSELFGSTTVNLCLYNNKTSPCVRESSSPCGGCTLLPD